MMDTMTGNKQATGTRADPAASAPINEVTLVVCDPAGIVQGVCGGARRDVIPCSSVRQRHFAEIFGQDSGLAEWLNGHVARLPLEEDYRAETTLEYGAGLLHVRVESLRCDEELFGFVLTLVPPSAAAAADRLEEGDAVVSRRQWHEIKNYIGALKLYTTFLSRKTLEGDEGLTVEKMVRGINSLIDYLAKIRRGEAQ